jgi:hypothetical protein
MLEMMVVVLLAAIIAQMTYKGFGMVWSQVSAREARTVFHGLVSRTRAQAIESGMRTVLLADAAGDSVMILANGRIVENVRFMEEMGVDIRGPERVTRICMTPRGFANPLCNSFDSTIRMTFVRGLRSDTVQISPMGQLRW